MKHRISVAAYELRCVVRLEWMQQRTEMTAFNVVSFALRQPTNGPLAQLDRAPAF